MLLVTDLYKSVGRQNKALKYITNVQTGFSFSDALLRYSQKCDDVNKVLPFEKRRTKFMIQQVLYINI